MEHLRYNALGVQLGIERMGCWAHARRKFVEAQKVQPKGKTGRADIALNLINKLYGIERDLEDVGDVHRHEADSTTICRCWRSCTPGWRKPSHK